MFCISKGTNFRSESSEVLTAWKIANSAGHPSNKLTISELTSVNIWNGELLPYIFSHSPPKYMAVKGNNEHSRNITDRFSLGKKYWKPQDRSMKSEAKSDTAFRPLNEVKTVEGIACQQVKKEACILIPKNKPGRSRSPRSHPKPERSLAQGQAALRGS